MENADPRYFTSNGYPKVQHTIYGKRDQMCYKINGHFYTARGVRYPDRLDDVEAKRLYMPENEKVLLREREEKTADAAKKVALLVSEDVPYVGNPEAKSLKSFIKDLNSDKRGKFTGRGVI